MLSLGLKIFILQKFWVKIKILSVHDFLCWKFAVVCQNAVGNCQCVGKLISALFTYSWHQWVFRKVRLIDLSGKNNCYVWELSECRLQMYYCVFDHLFYIMKFYLQKEMALCFPDGRGRAGMLQQLERRRPHTA